MKVLVAGDFCPRAQVAEAFECGDYQMVLNEVKSFFASSDYSIVNLECPVTNGPGKPIAKLGNNLHCSKRGIDALKWMGCNCVTLANNHFYDYGDAGVKNTLEGCRAAGIDTVGGGENIMEASMILYKQIAGQTLAVINCCEREFSIATKTSGGSNPINPIRQFYAIREARSKADFVLVIIHGGHEHFQLPSPRMVETYRFFVDAGADAVVNHHQHCYSGYEVYHGKPVFYGLGNFCFAPGKRKVQSTWFDGFFIVIEFLKENASFTIHPYRQCEGKPKIEVLEQNAFDKEIKRLNSIIADPNALFRVVEDYYISSSDSISNIFEPIRNRFYLGFRRRGWLPSLISQNRKLAAADYISCEAHRDRLLSWLRNGNH